jgi:hypothetical protein
MTLRNELMSGAARMMVILRDPPESLESHEYQWFTKGQGGLY